MKVAVGNLNKLKVVKEVQAGYYLDGGLDGEILLPFSSTATRFKVDEEVEVFIYHDSEDRLIATTEKPTAKVDEFAHLKVVGLESVGAFLHWNLAKDILLPYREITRDLEIGDYVVVYIYLDKSGRVAATMRTNKYLTTSLAPYKPGDKVDLLISAETDLGFKAIVDSKYSGTLYDNEIFEQLKIGQKLPGYVKKVRDDGKIDLLLQPFGNKGATDLGQSILDELQRAGGHLKINDKTPAEEIYNLFGVSKKKYKIALGGLYKKRLITVGDDGIRLVTTSSK